VEDVDRTTSFGLFVYSHLHSIDAYISGKC